MLPQVSPKLWCKLSPHVVDHCKAGEVQVAKDKEITEESYIYEEVDSEFAVSSEDCQACASAYKDAGGCPYALESKWYKIRMPSECYLKFHPDFAVNCRPHVVDFCKAGEVQAAKEKIQPESLTKSLNGTHISVKLFAIIGFISSIYCIAKATLTTPGYKHIPEEPKSKTLSEFIA